MGVVYRAQLHGEGGFVQDYALKQLHAHLADDPEVVRMFLDEARLAGLVRHPNIVTTFDVGKDGREYYIVMELVDGASVDELLEPRQPLPVAIAARIVLDTLAALAAAHSAKDGEGHALELVHRDVSPANVLVGRDGVTKLTDFGIAKARERLRTTVGFELKGKLGYMPPEQLETGVVDARADLFSTGVLLWEALRGERMLGDRRRLQELERDLSPSWFGTAEGNALDDVVRRAVRVSPDDRFGSARAMSEALEEACARSGTRIASAPEVGRFVADHRALRPRREEAPVSPSPRTNESTASGVADVAWAPARQQATMVMTATPLAPVTSTRRWPIVAVAGAATILMATVGVALARRGESRVLPAVANVAPPENSSEVAVAPNEIVEAAPTAVPPLATAASVVPARTPETRPPARRSRRPTATQEAPDPFGGRH